ncbi:D-alanine--D-alanine ligase [Haliangium ochraceum]|uniref:D-alanine--D-alanine ligase n=1 Tax=Haliangium ochraceum (strain DSM 14365 / JCM 11303 / SMP-2) TaxID=502025 RepID=D0LKT8_HALO1|nr:D-alanine--D-alanine ligase [Haliangium ochraceum]ACY16658.1 D-alanine/D-alanine ligase [Haliangium ochraceum DSM 14365]
MKSRRIGVLMGGLSSEKAISLATGDAVMASLEDRGYDVQKIFVDRDVDMALRQANIDVAFIALHGRFGEDGCIQGLLETMGIPYTGSGVMASALAMNKAKSKEMFRLHNLPTPSYYVLNRVDEHDVLGCHGDFGYPVVVKPLTEGSSVGVSLASTPEELLAACERAFVFDHSVVVERFVEGMEVSVAVLEDRALGAVEVASEGPLFDYGAKYTSGATEYIIPPRLSPERYRGVLTQAVRAHLALDCSGASRVDMIVSPTGNEYILEVNTLPALAPRSLLPKIAVAAGMDFDDLVEAILLGARLGQTRERGERRGTTRPFSGPERRHVAVVEHH